MKQVYHTYLSIIKKKLHRLRVQDCSSKRRIFSINRISKETVYASVSLALLS